MKLLKWLWKNKWLLSLIAEGYELIAGEIKKNRNKNKPVASDQVPVEKTEPGKITEKSDSIISKTITPKA
jgi:hypothetical protein